MAADTATKIRKKLEPSCVPDSTKDVSCRRGLVAVGVANGRYGFRCNTVIAVSEPMLMNSHRVNPVATVRQPTALSERMESEVPIKNSTRIMPRRAISERCGAHPEMVEL